jgi:hypothetical protein
MDPVGIFFKWVQPESVPTNYFKQFKIIFIERPRLFILEYFSKNNSYFDINMWHVDGQMAGLTFPCH